MVKQLFSAIRTRMSMLRAIVRVWTRRQNRKLEVQRILAHDVYTDSVHFGRKSMSCVYDLLSPIGKVYFHLYQIRATLAFVTRRLFVIMFVMTVYTYALQIS